MRRIFSFEPDNSIYNGFIDGNNPPIEYKYLKVFFNLGLLGKNRRHRADRRRSGPSFAAYWAGIDLCNGTVSRGTHNVKWNDSNSVDQKYRISKNKITPRQGSGSYISHMLGFARRYDKKIFYLWGGMPEHSFPDDAIPVSFEDWREISGLIREILSFQKKTYLKRRDSVNDFFDLFNNRPARRFMRDHGVSDFVIYEEHGPIGLIKKYFRGCWSALIVNPDKEILSLLRGEVLYWRTVGNCILLDMDDAMRIWLQTERGSDAKLIDLKN